ncbi:hypothetical protein MMC30_000791 [Trapelia coarctata]|nr:hypothetical protein [Trapelia coarctata]
MWLPVNLLIVIFFSLCAAFPATDKSSTGGSRPPSSDSSRGGLPSRPGTPPQAAPLSPANVPLPVQPGNPNPPPDRHEGVWTTDDGVTHGQYDDNPVRGVGLHAQHLEYNYRKHPENNQPFLVNLDDKATKKKLRDSLIGNKPERPGYSRDHKPPNVQVVGPDRKSRTTVQNLPKSESDREWRLLGKVYAEAIKANRRKEDGVIHLHPGTGRSRPPSDGSLGGSLSSVDSNSKPQKKPPGPRKPTPPPPSPRETRSKSKAQAQAQAQAQAGQQKPAWNAGPGAQTPQPKKKQNTPPDAPKKPAVAPLNLAIRPRPQSNSRIPFPLGSDRPQSPPAPAPPPPVAGPSSNTRPSRRPAPEPPRTPSLPPRAPSPPSPPSPPGKGKGKMLRRRTL